MKETMMWMLRSVLLIWVLMYVVVDVVVEGHGENGVDEHHHSVYHGKLRWFLFSV